MKKFLTIALKNAVNAILVNVLPVIMDNGHFNVRTAHGWEHVGMLAVSAIAAREGIVWVPALLKWSSTDSTPEITP